MIEKGNLELKPIQVEYIKVDKDSVELFSALKSMCGEDIVITYETAPTIGDFWNIKLYDSVKDKNVIVPIGSYIIKIDDGFTLVDSTDIKNYFNIIEKQ